MRRYYQKPESDIRITNYTASYAKAKVEFRPNLCLTSAYGILRKRLERFYKLYEKEEAVDLNELQDIKILHNLKKTQHYLQNSDFSISYAKNILNKEDSQNKKGQDTTSYENVKDQYSYETNLHDIFDPEFSSFFFLNMSKGISDMKNEIVTLKGSEKISYYRNEICLNYSDNVPSLKNKQNQYNFDRFHMTEFSESCLPSMHDVIEFRSDYIDSQSKFEYTGENAKKQKFMYENIGVLHSPLSSEENNKNKRVLIEKNTGSHDFGNINLAELERNLINHKPSLSTNEVFYRENVKDEENCYKVSTIIEDEPLNTDDIYNKLYKKPE